MDNLKKEIKEQFGANLMFDADSEPNRYMFNEKQLDVFIDEVVKKMNYMRSSLQLKSKEIPTFEVWKSKLKKSETGSYLVGIFWCGEDSLIDIYEEEIIT